jgi:hypothetical protein
MNGVLSEDVFVCLCLRVVEGPAVKKVELLMGSSLAQRYPQTERICRKRVTAGARACPRSRSLHVPSVREGLASRPSGARYFGGWSERAPMDRNHSITFSR